MNLVVGATGTLGSEICRLLVAARQPVRASLLNENLIQPKKLEMGIFS